MICRLYRLFVLCCFVGGIIVQLITVLVHIDIGIRFQHLVQCGVVEWNHTSAGCDRRESTDRFLGVSGRYLPQRLKTFERFQIHVITK